MADPEQVNGEKYVTWKGLLSLLGSICGAAIVGAWAVFQVHAADPHKDAVPLHVVTGVQQDTTTIVEVLKLQYISRKTILELKQAREGLTPAEQVELRGTIQILKTLSRRGTNS